MMQERVQNTQRRAVSFVAVLNDSAFKKGVEDAYGYRPFDPPATCDLKDNPTTAHCLYERGRQAAYYAMSKGMDRIRIGEALIEGYLERSIL